MSPGPAEPPSTWTPREVADRQVAWWWQYAVAAEPTGTLSRELYAHFVRFCSELRPGGWAEVPTETMWGRVLSETYGARSVHTATGNRRPLRPILDIDAVLAEIAAAG